jgi:hypothetical protein
MEQTKLVTSAYYNISGHPHHGADRYLRLIKSLPNIAENTQLPIVCYTSKLHGCYDELARVLDTRKLDNVTLKVYELEDHPLHESVLKIRQSDSILGERYTSRPIIVYWAKFDFLLNEMDADEYIYWIDGGLSHNGLFPKRFSIGDQTGYGFTDYNCTFNFSCFSKESFGRINTFVGDKILHMVRQSCDADLYAIHKIPELAKQFIIPSNQHWPVAGIFGAHTSKSSLKTYLHAAQNVLQTLVNHNQLTVEEAIMGYLNVTNPDWFKQYHFENFYTEDNTEPFLHFKEDGSFYHHFNRILCDTEPLVDYLGNF